MWRPTPPRKHQPRGLAAVKHRQVATEQNKRVVRAFGAVAAVQMAAQADWPDEMKRDLQAAKTAEQHQRWAEKWALHLSG